MGEFAQTNYNNAITRDNLLSMLYPRLILALQLLSDDGVLFCSIDDRNQAYVKCLFDEIFGEENFISNLIWQKKKGGSQDAQHFAKEHEYILCYVKKDWQINEQTQEQDEKEFNKIINGKKAKILKLEKWGNHSLRIDRPTLYYPIKDPEGNDFYPTAPNGKDGCWRKKPENLDSDHIYWREDSKGKLTPYEVLYFDEMKTKDKIIKIRTIFTEYGTTTDATKEIQSIFGDKIFDTPKPSNLIKHLMKVSSQKDSIILDFFAGSGTTGHAVLELNREDGGHRKFILCQLNEKTDTTPNGIAYDVTAKRLKRVMTGECYDGIKPEAWLKKNEPYGGALEVYEIGEVPSFEATEGKTPFEVIDETLYGKEKFKTIKEKIEWVCTNFEKTQKYLEKSDRNQECED